MFSNSNDDALVNYRGHSRNYGFNATVNPRPRIGFDLAYNYSDVMQDGLICFIGTPPTGVRVLGRILASIFAEVERESWNNEK